MPQWAKDCLIVGRKRQNNTSFLDNEYFLDRTRVVANCFYCKCNYFSLNGNYMFLGTFYYTTSESKLPTFFQILPCFLPFFPLPRARARQMVFFFCLHSFTRCAHLVAVQWNRGEGFCVLPFTFSRDVLGSCRLSIFTAFLLTRWPDWSGRRRRPGR